MKGTFTLIKAGGSLITKKGKEVMNNLFLEKLGRALQNSFKNIILVHGTGEIGKPPALKYKYVNTGFLPMGMKGTAIKIEKSINQLNKNVIRAMEKRNIHCVGISNAYFKGYFSNNWNKKRLRLKILNSLDSGEIPVFFGNFIPVKNGFRILSSDEIMLALSGLLKPEKVIFLTNTNGILRMNGKPYTTFRQKDLHRIQGSPNDVSGGMAAKAEVALQISRLGNQCLIANGKKSTVLRSLRDNKQLPSCSSTEVKPI